MRNFKLSENYREQHDKVQLVHEYCPNMNKFLFEKSIISHKLQLNDFECLYASVVDQYRFSILDSLRLTLVSEIGVVKLSPNFDCNIRSLNYL